MEHKIMDTTPDGVKMREAIAALPHVRELWEVPAQDLWVGRAMGMLRDTRPSLSDAIDETTAKIALQVSDELDLYDGVYVLNRAELAGVVTKAAHAGAAVVAIAVGEAEHTIHEITGM